jgi:hypothetical protein
MDSPSKSHTPLVHSPSLHRLAVEGPSLSRQQTSGTPLTPKPSLFNLALRNVSGSDGMPRTLSASSLHTARLASGDVTLSNKHSLQTASKHSSSSKSLVKSSQHMEDSASQSLASQSVLESMLDEIRAAEVVSTQVIDSPLAASTPRRAVP